jgi:hypothetical protein
MRFLGLSLLNGSQASKNFNTEKPEDREDPRKKTRGSAAVRPGRTASACHRGRLRRFARGTTTTAAAR